MRLKIALGPLHGSGARTAAGDEVLTAFLWVLPPGQNYDFQATTLPCAKTQRSVTGPSGVSISNEQLRIVSLRVISSQRSIRARWARWISDSLMSTRIVAFKFSLLLVSPRRPL